MRAQPETIRLGIHEWTIRPLTIAQVQAIEPVLQDSGEARIGNVASALAILRIALKRDHADVLDGLDEMEAGAGEIAAAMAVILRLGGFLPQILSGDDAPGKAHAGRTPAAIDPSL